MKTNHHSHCPLSLPWSSSHHCRLSSRRVSPSSIISSRHSPSPIPHTSTTHTYYLVAGLPTHDRHPCHRWRRSRAEDVCVRCHLYTSFPDSPLPFNSVVVLQTSMLHHHHPHSCQHTYVLLSSHHPLSTLILSYNEYT